MFVPETHSIEIYSSAEAMVNSYQEGIEKLTQAYDLLGQAESLLNKAVNYPRTLAKGSYLRTVGSNDLAEIIKDNHKGAWNRIIEKMQLRNLLSKKRFEEIEKQIEKGEVPELTVDNIFGLVQDMTENISGFLQECIAETFDWLIPYWRNEYKTNKEHKVGPKVIKDGIVNYYGVSHHYRQNLISLDNVFHLLDGKGPVKGLGTLVNAIELTIRDKKDNECETEYFKVRWFKKGSLHIWFKRNDLLDELNRIGAGGKPHLGKKTD